MKKPNQSGFTIIEVLAAIAVLTVGILVIVSSFSVNLKQSSQTREELLAAVVMESLVEEVLDHNYGAAPPPNWRNGTVTLNEVVEGMTVQTEFVQSVTQSKANGNGSFFNQNQQKDLSANSDTVTLSVSWVQPTDLGNSSFKRSLKSELLVTRKP